MDLTRFSVSGKNLGRQPEIKKANLNNALEREETVDVLMKLLKRQNFQLSRDIYQKKQEHLTDYGNCFWCSPPRRLSLFAFPEHSVFHASPVRSGGRSNCQGTSSDLEYLEA